MNYDISPTTNPLSGAELYKGRTVCFSDVTTNPNNFGILEVSDKSGSKGAWKAVINNTLYYFTSEGYSIETTPKRLYGIKLPEGASLDITSSTAITRNGNTTTLSNLAPKDNFAICAMQALLSNIPNVESLDDATILTLVIKAYKIAQAMLYIGTLARGNDAPSSQTEPSSVSVDSNNLGNNTDKLLYNLNETLKAIKAQDATQFSTGIKISTITPTVKIDNPSGDDLAISGGGGGGTSIDAQALKEACENNLNWSRLTTGDLVSVVGFCYKNSSSSERIPAENNISHVMSLLEAEELKTSNNSVWYWLRKYDNTIITDIDSFFAAYSTQINGWIDDRGSANIASGGEWENVLNTLIDSRISVKVKASALNS